MQEEKTVHDGVNFAEIEQEFVRRRFYPAFHWRASDTFSPVNPLRVPLSQARVAFVTTAGAHLANQPAFDIRDPAGDPSYRVFPSTTPLSEIVLTHSGYDTRRASTDKNVVLPLDHLRACVHEGRIGSLSSMVVSFMGYIANPEPLVRETAPDIARQLLEEVVDLVLLSPA